MGKGASRRAGVGRVGAEFQHPANDGTMIPLHDDNPTEQDTVVTIAFIAACVLVSFYQASLAARLRRDLRL